VEEFVVVPEACDGCHTHPSRGYAVGVAIDGFRCDGERLFTRP